MTLPNDGHGRGFCSAIVQCAYHQHLVLCTVRSEVTNMVYICIVHYYIMVIIDIDIVIDIVIDRYIRIRQDRDCFLSIASVHRK